MSTHHFRIGQRVTGDHLGTPVTGTVLRVRSSILDRSISILDVDVNGQEVHLRADWCSPARAPKETPVTTAEPVAPPTHEFLPGSRVGLRGGENGAWTAVVQERPNEGGFMPVVREVDEHRMTVQAANAWPMPGFRVGERVSVVSGDWMGALGEITELHPGEAPEATVRRKDGPVTRLPLTALVRLREDLPGQADPPADTEAPAPAEGWMFPNGSHLAHWGNGASVLCGRMVPSGTPVTGDELGAYADRRCKKCDKALEKRTATPDETPAETPAPSIAEMLRSAQEVPQGVVTVPWLSLRPSPLNPRKKFEPDALRELALDIHAKGVLQNLVVRPHPQQPGAYEIAAGERRYRAVELLTKGIEVDGAVIDASVKFPIPVLVREMNDRELLEVATAENVQRRRMTPLEEAEAFAAIAAQGATPAEIAHKFGYAERTVTRRIQIAQNLTDSVKQAFDEGKLTLEKAEIIALAPPKMQKSLADSAAYTPVSSLRTSVNQRHFLVKNRLFDESAYSGEIVQDLFGDVEAYYQDAAQAVALQTAHLETLAEQARQRGAAFAQVIVHGGAYHELHYQFPKREGATGVVYVLDTRTGATVTHQGCTTREGVGLSQPTAAPERPVIGWASRNAISKIQGAALERALFANPRAAQAAWVAGIFDDSEGLRCDFPSPEMMDFAARLDDLTGGVLRPPLPGESAESVVHLGTLPQEDEGTDPDYYGEDDVYRALLTLPDEDFSRLMGLTAALYAGSSATGPVTPLLLRDLGVDLAGQVELTAELLKDMNRLALLEVAKEAGLPEAEVQDLTEERLRKRLIKEAPSLQARGFVPSAVDFPRPVAD